MSLQPSACANEAAPPWKSELLAAAIRQGPSFLILLLVLSGLWQTGRYVAEVGVPAHLDQIKQGYVEIQAAHSRDLQRVIAAFEAERSRSRDVVAAIDRLGDQRELLKQSHDLLGQAVAELRGLRTAK